MSDVLCQYVTGDITASNTNATISGFTQVDPLSTLILPAGSRHDTASVGRVSGTALPPWLFHHIAADLADDGASIALQRDKGSDPASITVRAAVQLITYTGVFGGANEFVRRFKTTLTFTNGLTTIDSGDITGFNDITRCVPIAYCRTTRSSTAMGETMVRVQIVDVSGAKRVRLSRGLGSGTIVAVIYVWEFTGLNWVVRSVDHTFTAGDANEDDTITSIGSAPAFVIRTGTTVGSDNGPSHGTQFSYPTSATNLRQRLEQKATTNTMTSYLIGNSQLVVERLGTPDGSVPWAQATSPQIENLTVTTLPSLSTSAFILQAGSNIAGFANNPGGTWGGRFTTTANFEARRGDSTSYGATDYVLFSIDMSGLSFAPAIASVTGIVEGGTFTITGTDFKPGGIAPTVAIDGVAQTVDTSSNTSIGCTVVLGTLDYGDHTLTVTTSLSSITTHVIVSPVAGTAYVNLTALAPAAQRVTGSADLAIGDQIAYDNTVTILEDGSFLAPGALASFNYRINDGTGWGAQATQTLITPIVAPVLVGTIPTFSFYTLTDVQFDLGGYASGWETLTINGEMQVGLLPLAGVPRDTGVVAGRFNVPSDVINATTHTVTFTNSAGSTVSNAFNIEFIDRPIPAVEVYAIKAGYFGGVYRNISDVFVIHFPEEFSPYWMAFVSAPPSDWTPRLQAFSPYIDREILDF